jgi:hypothetical protein
VLAALGVLGGIVAAIRVDPYLMGVAAVIVVANAAGGLIGRRQKSPQIDHDFGGAGATA